ncbi:efflux RND transporter periplasmic adaptor subunit [Sulfidibacter corallicola]|uniref:Efflux RND transporter periplasmic adaptor subunit n=1 Tax=Sulfidibacter corallicola TaxID=2818388 RepID=A0A8A4TWD8_SULCO|nr:efflux RND transporter periplasmic adaptor subunit [Sulfidibacter corallicola]QTD53444.1 efflux RND transporter periplasmic adaptor subunit [Sulfidibacter corallicola]
MLPLALLLITCDSFQNKDESDNAKRRDKKEEAVPVEVATIDTGGIEAILKMTATLEAEEQVKVLARTTNELVELLVEEGDVVEKDQILARLENRNQRLVVEKAQASLAKAKRELDRQRRLFEKNMTTEQAYNDAKTEAEQQEISLKEAELDLDYTVIRAPIAGTVTQRLVNLGDQISANQHLFDLVDFGTVVARLYVPEKYLPDLRLELPARIRTPIYADSDFHGSIRRIAPTVDAKTGTVKVTVGVDELESLRPGMYVNVDLVLNTKQNAVLIPKKALVYDNDQIFVYRMGEKRRVERLEITPRLTDRNFVEPESGLAAGDQVVIAGQAGLKPNALVRIPGDPKPVAEDSEKERREVRRRNQDNAD